MKKTIIALLVVFFSIAVLNVPSRGQGVKVLFDESHGQYYNSAKCEDFINNLSVWGYEVVVNRETITVELLSEFKILILNNPKNDLTAGEVEAIKWFVKSGGGLLICGDWARYVNQDALNAITGEFGITFNKDSIHDPDDNTGKIYYPLLHNIKPHPITEGVTEVQYNGCSLEVSGSAAAIVVGDENTFADKNQNHKQDSDEKVGESVVAVAVASVSGGGRIVATGSACMWRTKYGYFNTNQKLAKNIMAWLSAGVGEITVYTLGEINRLGSAVALLGSKSKGMDARAAMLLSSLMTVTTAKDVDYPNLKGKNLIVVGGPIANSVSAQVNSLAGVSFIVATDSITIKVEGKEYTWYRSDWKKNDYAVAFLVQSEGRYILAIEGCTRYGTYAVALYLKAHFNELAGKKVIVIRWVDTDGNGDVNAADTIELVASH